MQRAHARHTHYMGQEVYMEHKLLEIFERVMGLKTGEHEFQEARWN
jgi:hypothetical protein